MKRHEFILEYTLEQSRLTVMKSIVLTSFCALLMQQAQVANSQSSPSANQLVNYAATHTNNTFVFAQNAFGNVYPTLTASLAVGTRGSNVFLEDIFLIEKLQSLNRERIPERLVHAKGAGALGYFQVTNDISQYTKAKFLQPRKRTKVAVRLSTGAGESGSADTNFDLKGLSVKFYTDDGIHDMVGINFPVFLVRDGMLFTDVVRARKRNPQTHLFDPNSLWDMASYRTEMTMFMLFFFSDSAFPKSFRYIDGFPVHTFKMVNENGEAVYVKFHFISNQKKEFITLQESFQLAGSNPDLMLADLFDYIGNKIYPTWTLKIQVMTFEQAKRHPYNPFDSTKFWKVEDYPLITVGKLVLNENPENYFVQVEQMAFSPGRMVPGIQASPDRLLHTRMFAYPDTQLHRLGSNYAQIPVNSCPFQVHTYQRDGLMNVGTNGGAAPNYYPNGFNGLNSNFEDYAKQQAFDVCGDVDRVDTGNDDNFLLPAFYWKNYVGPAERERIIANMAASLSLTDKRVQTNVLKNIAYKVSPELGDKLKAALSM